MQTWLHTTTTVPAAPAVPGHTANRPPTACPGPARPPPVRRSRSLMRDWASPNAKKGRTLTKASSRGASFHHPGTRPGAVGHQGQQPPATVDSSRDASPASGEHRPPSDDDSSRSPDGREQQLHVEERRRARVDGPASPEHAAAAAGNGGRAGPGSARTKTVWYGISQPSRLVASAASPTRRWPVETAVYWPLDLLPASCPDARVFTFGYETAILAQGQLAPGQLDIFMRGRELLEVLDELRRGDERNREVVFVAHSTGAIVVKEVGSPRGRGFFFVWRIQ